MATKTVHEISIEADTSSTKAAIRDLSAEYVRVQKKIIEGNSAVTKSELDIVAAYDGRIKELKNLERAQAQLARLDKEAAKGVKDLTNSVKGFGGASKDAAGGASSLKTQFTDMAKKAGLAALAIKGIQVATDLVKSGFDDLTESIKNSQVLGLTMVQFEGLNTLATSAGASIDDLRNTFGALARAGKDPWEGLLEIADALEGMGTEAERTKYMVELYGESGTKLIPMLMGGKEGLLDAMEAAQKYGLVIGKDAVEAHNRLNAELVNLQTEARGLSRQLSTEVTPLLTAFLQNLRGSSAASNALGTALKALGYVASYIFEALRAVVEAVVTNIKSAVRVLDSLWEGFKGNLRAVALLVQGDFAGAWEAVKTGPVGFIDAVKEGFSDLGGVLDDAKTRTENLDAAFWGAAEGAQALADGMMSIERPELDHSSVSEEEQLKALAKMRADAKRAQDRIDADNKRRADKRRAAEEKARKEAEKAGEDAAKALMASLEAGVDAEEDAARKRIDDWTKIELFKLKQKIAIDKKYDELVAKAEEKRLEELEKAAEEAARKAEAVMKSLQSELLSGASSAGSIIADGLFGPMEEGVNRMEQMGKQLLALLAEIAIKAAAAFAIQAATGTAGGGIGGAIASAVGFASGGYVSGPGTSTSDSIPARLSNGEYVINAQSVDKYGRAFFDRLNGLMPTAFAGGGSAGSSEIVIVNPPTERDFENFVSSNRGRRLIINATRGLS